MRLLRSLAPGLGALCLAFPLSAQRTVRPAPKPAVKSAPAADTGRAPTTGYLQGVAYDSIHAEPLVGAVVQVDGAARLGVTDSLGRFLIDSVSPGEHRVLVDHPVLDTLGISLVTPPLTFAANQVTRSLIILPSSSALVGVLCPPARRTLGPGALVGRVREPDSDVPATGARVSIVWYDPDPPGLPPSLRPTRKTPRVRETTVAADGTYRLCGLPEQYDGKLQAQRKDGGATAEVPVTQDGGLLALRSMSVAPLARVAVRDSTGIMRPVQRGTARVLGKVVNRNGAPVAGARVGLMGTSAAALTKANGEFVLDSLPSGTQAVVVRQLGYRPAEVPVELSARSPARVTVQLGTFVPELSPVEVVSRRDQGLEEVGFLQRKRTSAGGHFIDEETVAKRGTMRFTDVLRTIPGIKVSQENGQNFVSSTRSATGNGCVTMWVDGGQWQQLEPGDIDSYIQSTDVAGVEVYSSTSAPAQFTTPGQSCATVVVWTKTRVMSRSRK